MCKDFDINGVHKYKYIYDDESSINEEENSDKEDDEF